jgi:hypothetical protein
MRVPVDRRLLLAARWPFGIVLTSWNYMWRTTPMHRRELPGTPDEDFPPPLPENIDKQGLQTPDDGVGPLFHRTYTTRIRDAKITPEQLIERLKQDPNEVAPTEFAKFTSEDGRIETGGELLVRMPGPWDGPIRTIETTPTSFRFATCDGHLEAGQIEWRAGSEDGHLVFRITSWARAGDRVSALMHDGLRMAKEVQLHMWTSVSEQVAKLTGGRATGGIDIETRRVDVDAI